jgi:rfaE bifunctional protein nucleotidyltransferase chain/domain
MIDKFNVVTSKIVDKNQLNTLLSYWRFKEKKIVFTNGCFDIIHRGHVEYLSKAASHGDILLVGVNSDESVKRLKGSKRPILDEYSRLLMLSAFQFVTNVVVFDEDTPYNLIKFVKPDVLIKGSDYRPEDIVGGDIVTANNGQILTIDFVEGFSTSNLIKKIKAIDI